MAYAISTNTTVRNTSGGLLASIKDAFARHTVYMTTLRELQSLNQRELDDLGIHRAMIKEIAREAANRA